MRRNPLDRARERTKEGNLSGRARGIRIPEELEHDIGREAEERGKSWSATTTELLTEAVRMRRVPGIALADGPAGQRGLSVSDPLDFALSEGRVLITPHRDDFIRLARAAYASGQPCAGILIVAVTVPTATGRAWRTHSSAGTICTPTPLPPGS